MRAAVAVLYLKRCMSLYIRTCIYIVAFALGPTLEKFALIFFYIMALLIYKFAHVQTVCATAICIT